MGVCVVSRLMTINKWKGYFVHKYVLAKAKEMREEKGVSMRAAIIALQKRIRARTSSSDTLQERTDMLNEMLTIKTDNTV